MQLLELFCMEGESMEVTQYVAARPMLSFLLLKGMGRECGGNDDRRSR
jgi:hypothetical protein